MSRQAREKSQSGIYHIILRGINKQILFEDDEDRERFIGCLQLYKSVSQYAVYGYCLMDNHVHLLIKEGLEAIGQTMKRIGVSYVAWHNRKYNRCGHLFQDRFKSEPVETDEYLLTVLRYIQQNPVESGQAANVQSYQWSSYNEYIGWHKFVDIDFVLAMFSSKPEEAISRFKIFMKKQAADICLDIDERAKLTDQEVKFIIQQYGDVAMPADLQNIGKVKRDELLRKVKRIEGVSTRQIARITGISQTIIAKA